MYIGIIAHSLAVNSEVKGCPNYQCLTSARHCKPRLGSLTQGSSFSFSFASDNQDKALAKKKPIPLNHQEESSGHRISKFISLQVPSPFFPPSSHSFPAVYLYRRSLPMQCV